jgi:hypothetical protein
VVTCERGRGQQAVRRAAASVVGRAQCLHMSAARNKRRATHARNSPCVVLTDQPSEPTRTSGEQCPHFSACQIPVQEHLTSQTYRTWCSQNNATPQPTHAFSRVTNLLQMPSSTGQGNKVECKGEDEAGESTQPVARHDRMSSHQPAAEHNQLQQARKTGDA